MALLASNIPIPQYGIVLSNAYIEVVQFGWQKPMFTANVMLHVWQSPEASRDPSIQPFEIFKTITFDNNFQTPLIQQIVDDVETKIVAALQESGSTATKTPTIWIKMIMEAMQQQIQQQQLNEQMKLEQQIKQLNNSEANNLENS